MEAAVEAGLAHFTDTRQKTLELLTGCSQEQLDRRPAPRKWSAGEVFDHLILADGINRRGIEALIELARSGRRPYLRLSFSDVDVSVAYIPKALLPWFDLPFTMANLFVPAAVRDLLARSRWLPVQNPTEATPHRGRPKEELRRGLAASLEATRQLFAQHPSLDYRQMVLAHPLMGENDVPGILQFMRAHEERHQQQIREALRRIGAEEQA